MSNKKKKNKTPKSNNPTLFAFDGSIRLYEDGSMLGLHTQVNTNEWSLIVEETIKYQIFLECLKEYAFQELDEKWTAKDEWFRLQLDIAVSRVRNIDPILAAKWNIDEIKKEYLNKMKDGTAQIQQLIADMKQQQQGVLAATKVSDL